MAASMPGTCARDQCAGIIPASAPSRKPRYAVKLQSNRFSCKALPNGPVPTGDAGPLLTDSGKDSGRPVINRVHSRVRAKSVMEHPLMRAGSRGGCALALTSRPSMAAFGRCHFSPAPEMQPGGTDAENCTPPGKLRALSGGAYFSCNPARVPRGLDWPPVADRRLARALRPSAVRSPD